MKPDRAIKKFLNDHPDKMIVNRDYVLDLKAQIDARKPCHPELEADLSLYGSHYHDEAGNRLDPLKVQIAAPRPLPPAGF